MTAAVARQEVDAPFPQALGFLFEPARYKVAYGGRGGGKSWSFARALLTMGLNRPLRVGCAREFMNSIADSVHKLLADQIEALHLEHQYQVQERSIRGANGTEFIFFGLHHNVDKVKSMEGLDVVWVNEAKDVSKSSWNTLIPTVRKDGSEIWIEFNPELDSDETYQRFVLQPPAGAVVRKINYSDNPWFPPVLEAERLALKTRDPDSYLNVWEGFTRQTLDGAIFATELRAAQADGRICKVPYDKAKPVQTFWDLGWADKTSIWFAQTVGMENRVIDFHQDSQKTIPEFLTVLQGKGYVYGPDWMPHDAQSKQLASGGRSIEQIMRAAGRTVRIIPRTPLVAQINAARTFMASCFFDEVKCAEGIQALRHYRYEVDPDTGLFGKKPLHDENSHAASAFQQMAMSLRETTVKPKAKAPGPMFTSPTGWMS